MEIQGCRKTAGGSCQSLDLLTSSTAVTPELLNSWTPETPELL
jgi:hypothetical protein